MKINYETILMWLIYTECIKSSATNIIDYNFLIKWVIITNLMLNDKQQKII